MSDEFRKIFVRKLAYYMQLNNKKQIDLMHDLGLKSATVSSWCTGKKLPRVDKIQLLADYFHIEKSDLLEECNLDYDSFFLSEEEKKIVKAWREASESEKKLILYALNLLDIDDMRKIFESRMK